MKTDVVHTHETVKKEDRNKKRKRDKTSGFILEWTKKIE